MTKIRRTGSGEMPDPKRGGARSRTGSSRRLAHADQGPVFRPRVAVRAQAGRRALPLVPHRFGRPADDPQPDKRSPATIRRSPRRCVAKDWAAKDWAAKDWAAKDWTAKDWATRATAISSSTVRSSRSAARRPASSCCSRASTSSAPTPRCCARCPSSTTSSTSCTPAAGTSGHCRCGSARTCWPGCCRSVTRCGTPSTGTTTAKRTTPKPAARAGKGSSPSAPMRRTGPAGAGTG